MSSSSDLQALRLQRDQLKSQLTQLGDMRPGSLVPRYRKCGKPNCRCAKSCAKKGEIGHGPSYSLTHPVAGKTITRIIPTGDAVVRTIQQLQEYQRFRALVHQLTAVSEQICDLELRQPSADDYKKNSARRPSRG